MTPHNLMEVEKAIAHLRLNPQPQDERFEELKQQYETVLSLLESEFLGAILTGKWEEFDEFIQGFKVDAADELDNPSSIPCLTTKES